MCPCYFSERAILSRGGAYAPAADSCKAILGVMCSTKIDYLALRPIKFDGVGDRRQGVPVFPPLPDHPASASVDFNRASLVSQTNLGDDEEGIAWDARLLHFAACEDNLFPERCSALDLDSQLTVSGAAEQVEAATVRHVTH